MQGKDPPQPARWMSGLVRVSMCQEGLVTKVKPIAEAVAEDSKPTDDKRLQSAEFITAR